MSGRPLRILVLANFRPGNANVIRDFLFSFNAYSQHRYFYVFNCLTLDEDTDFSSFDVILLFWSQSPIGPELAPALRRRIRTAQAVKLAFLQDEYQDVRARGEVLRELGVKVIFTTVAEPDHATFYPRSVVETLDATYTVLTGYVPAYLEHQPAPDPAGRTIDVSYRSRVVPFYLGDLGREKFVIADRFLRICAEHGLRADISVDEHDRIYGSAWLRFLRRSRCVLGSASGASVVDFTGQIRAASELHLARFPETSYDELRARFFAAVDGTVTIDTISPRVFEAAALHCTLVHHDGGYAGIIEPERHYIRVRKDYSNVADVVDRIRDDGYCRQLAATAHRDLVASGRYSYRRFGQEFDERLARHTPRSSTVRGPSRLAFYTRHYRLGEPLILPRRDSCMVAPTVMLPFAVAQAVLERLPAHRRSQMASRALLDPLRFVQLSHAAWCVIATTPPLRAIFLAYLRSATARKTTTLARLAEDLLKLDMVRRARAQIHPPPPFSIDVDFEPHSGEVILTSTSRPDERPAPAQPLADELERALVAGRVRTIVWSHASFGDRVWCEHWPLRPIPLGVGNGVYRFAALAKVCAQAPGAASALAALLSVSRAPSWPDGAPAARTS